MSLSLFATVMGSRFRLEREGVDIGEFEGCCRVDSMNERG